MFVLQKFCPQHKAPTGEIKNAQGAKRKQGNINDVENRMTVDQRHTFSFNDIIHDKSTLSTFLSFVTT
jgi:hypothetical protein